MKSYFRIILFVIISQFIVLPSVAQNNEIDSLLLVIKSNKHDSCKVNAYALLAKKMRRSSMDSAIQYARQGIQLAKKINYPKGLAECYNNLGNVCKNQSNLVEALNYHQKALKIRDSINDKKGIGKSYNNIGVIYFILKNDSLAMRYYLKSLEIKQEIGDKKGLSFCYNNIGNVKIVQKKYNDALSFFSKALIIKKEFADKQGMSFCYHSIGSVYFAMKKYNLAVENIESALTLKKELNDDYGISMLLLRLSEIKHIQAKNSNLLEQKQLYKDAILLCEKSLEISNKISTIRNQTMAYKYLAEIHASMHEYKKAYGFRKLYGIFKDSVLGFDQIKEIEQLKAEFQFINQQKEITNLEQDNQAQSVTVNNLERSHLWLYTILFFLLIVILILLVVRNGLKKKNLIISHQSDVIHDQVNEIIQQNEKLHDYQHHLEQKISERTTELEQAKEKAELSDRLKTSFLENLSHEVRTPLNSIVGFSDLLIETDNNEEISSKYLDAIQKGSASLLKIISSTLKMSSIQAGDYTITKSEFVISNFMLLIHQQFKVNQASDQVNFKLFIHPYLINKKVKTDENALSVILTNLLENAFKFTELGQIELGINPEKNKKLVFYVKDTGIGIAKSELSFIFDKFNKIEGTNKLYRGLGIGLTISKSLIEQLDGEIWVESETNKGSTFYFSLLSESVEY